MIKVRRNCFETNSSSTHSITIEDYCEPRKKNISIHKDSTSY